MGQELPHNWNVGAWHPASTSSLQQVPMGARVELPFVWSNVGGSRRLVLDFACMEARGWSSNTAYMVWNPFSALPTSLVRLAEARDAAAFCAVLEPLHFSEEIVRMLFASSVAAAAAVPPAEPRSFVAQSVQGLLNRQHLLDRQAVMRKEDEERQQREREQREREEALLEQPVTAARGLFDRPVHAPPHSGYDVAEDPDLQAALRMGARLPFDTEQPEESCFEFWGMDESAVTC